MTVQFVTNDAVKAFSHIDFTTNENPRRLFSATSGPCFFRDFCYSRSINYL